MIRRIASAVLALGLAGGFLVTAGAPPAAAVEGSQFDPGYIISDQNFFNGSAMTAGDVQSFLNSKVPTCQTGYVCLKSYVQTTPTIAADAYCNGYVGATNETAATIIAKVGASCNISQKVLLVILQKEMSLVEHTWPSSWRYVKAMGFGCPDSSLSISVDANQNGCYDLYEGFAQQVYYGARQYQKYATSPTSYNYRAGRYNNILYSPNSACGYSSVYIANQATAGLYNYTPYQPNAAALANLRGTGDGCSSYGNRNFWRLYWDYFGSPITDAALMRTAANPLIYLVSSGMKYPVTSYQTYVTLLPLGGPAYVSQGYLDAFPTGPNVGSVFRNESGAIAIFDRSTLYNFRTCDQLADFGGSCSSPQWVQLSAAQWSKFVQGPSLTNVIGTTTGGRWAVEDGSKSELLDDQAQADAGYPAEFVVLTDAAIGALPTVQPHVRDDVFIRDRTTGAYWAYFGGERHAISAADAAALNLPARAAGSLTSESLALLPAGGDLKTTVADSAGNVWILTATGRIQLTGVPGDGLPVLSDGLLAQFTSAGSIADGALVKGDANPTVYVIDAGVARRIPSWNALVSITVGPIAITTLPQSVVDAMPKGSRVLVSGTMVRSPNDPTIYLIDGLDNKVKVRSFATAAEAGFGGYSMVSDVDLAAYVPSGVQNFGYLCGSTKFVAAGGRWHEVAPENESAYAMPFVSVSEALCANVPVGVAAGTVIRTPDGAIYRLDALGKHKFTYARWIAVAPTPSFLQVSQAFADQFPTGAPA